MSREDGRHIALDLVLLAEGSTTFTSNAPATAPGRSPAWHQPSARVDAFQTLGVSRFLFSRTLFGQNRF
jgi:hypothetical protein